MGVKIILSVLLVFCLVIAIALYYSDLYGQNTTEVPTRSGSQNNWSGEDIATPPKIKRTACHSLFTLFDNANKYIKSFCRLEMKLNYDEAQTSCRDANMELFVIDDAKTEAAFEKVSRGNIPWGSVWINGVREGDKWFTYNPNRAPLFKDIAWMNPSSAAQIDGRDNPVCLRYHHQFGPYRALPFDCQMRCNAFCELREDF